MDVRIINADPGDGVSALLEFLRCVKEGKPAELRAEDYVIMTKDRYRFAVNQVALAGQEEENAAPDPAILLDESGDNTALTKLAREAARTMKQCEVQLNDLWQEGETRLSVKEIERIKNLLELADLHSRTAKATLVKFTGIAS